MSVKFDLKFVVNSDVLQINISNSLYKGLSREEEAPDHLIPSSLCVNGSVREALSSLSASFQAWMASFRGNFSLKREVHDQTQYRILFELHNDDDILDLLTFQLDTLFKKAFPQHSPQASLPRSECHRQLKVMRAFDSEFYRRIPKSHRETMYFYLESLGELSPSLIKSFHEGDYSLRFGQIYLKYGSLSILKAYAEGLISEQLASKSLLYDQCYRESKKPVVVHRLYGEEGQINSEALALLDKGLETYFSAEERGRVWIALKKLPTVETEFFVIETKVYSWTTLEVESRSLADLNLELALFHQTQFRLFYVQDGAQSGRQLIVPPALFYEILKVKFGSTAMEPNPVLGYFAKERLSDPVKRIVAIPCAHVETPQKLHQLDATPLMAYSHDLYHLYIESGNPHRRAWIELALLADPKTRSLVLDRDFPFYSRQETHEPNVGRTLVNDQEKFWYSLISLYERMKIINGPSIAEKTLRLFLSHVKSHEDKWKATYQIDLSSLVDAQQKENPGTHPLSLSLCLSFLS